VRTQILVTLGSIQGLEGWQVSPVQSEQRPGPDA
jgi:hypothetical protein